MDIGTGTFDPDKFDFDWKQLDDRGKVRLVSAVANQPPGLAILPVIRGIFSTVPAIQTSARDGLVRIFKNVAYRLDHTEPDVRGIALKEAALIASHLYPMITVDSDLDNLKYLVNALTAFGGQGAFFSFKLLLRGIAGPDVLFSIVRELPEQQRLGLVDEYLMADPSIRLKYAALFKDILNSITSREAVIFYYASLFDRECSADPFLNNIDPMLRDPDSLIENEIASESTDTVILGFKALAMVMEEVPSRLLLEYLEDQDVKKIRLTVYTLVEHAAIGRYPKLSKLLWQYLCRAGKNDREELTAAFKALAVGSGQPLFRLMDKMKADCPDLLPDIFREIAGLSRISFLFVQDMALNRDKYISHHPQVIQALILGMVRKRPERVIKILKSLPNEHKNNSLSLVETLNKLLAKESVTIKSQFDLKASFSKNIRYTRLKEQEKKHLFALRNKTGSADSFLNFQNRVLENIDLKEGRFTAATIYFNHAVIKGGNWTGIYMAGACFKASIMYGMTLANARFEDVCFDNALFRDVDASGAVFINCTFRGAKLFNCDFSHGNLSDTLFTGAFVSRTEFRETDLSFASFAHGDLSALSFTTAYLEHADFSYARAVFVRFPGYTASFLRTRGLDENARHHQLPGDVLPKFSPRALAEINLMIFCEFTRFGRIKFQAQNRLSLLAAFDVFKPGRAELFQIAPLLIHMNIELRGGNPIDPTTPCGIADFHPPRQAMTVLERYSKDQDLQAGINDNPAIEGVYTMGSIGSLAQTPDSDIDYWVCINGNEFSDEGLSLLEQKLRMLEILAGDLFNTSVTFFIVDIQKVRRNDFGGTSQESSGSAQAWLLKEEFYRTMIHVAGKLPLWAVVPTDISLNFYHLIYRRVSARRYIDLGDVHSVPLNEYYGASIWQMFKWLKSPFKSAIKLSLFELYAKSLGKEALLCNNYKNEWMNAGVQLRVARNDSYIAILDKLLTHYKAAGDRGAMDIILTCFFLKLEIIEESELDDTPFGVRRVLLERLVARWGWSRRRVLELGQFRSWPYEKIRSMSTAIEEYMFTKYDQVKQVFQDPSRQNVMISDQDRARLTRKVDVVYKDKFYKIKKLFLIAENDAYFSNLNLKYHIDGEKAGKWELFQKDEWEGKMIEAPVFRADRVEHICAWLIYNHLYNSDTDLGIVPNPSNIGYNDVQKLYQAINDFFALELGPASIFYDFSESQPTTISAFVTINLDTDQPRSSVEDYCIIYVNSWGEMFCRPSLEGASFSNLSLAKKDILSSLDIQTFPVNTKFYFPRGKVA